MTATGGTYRRHRDDNASAIISLVDVCKSYYKRGQIIDALKPVSFDVSQGEFVALVGPSGCGKSTVLNMVAGLIQPTSGQVRFRDTQLTDVNTSVGYMTQSDNLLPWRTVRKNVRFPLELTRGRQDRTTAVDTVLETVGLSGFANSYPSELSGGMRKRVALARTLVHQQEVLLMDEPFASLDAQLRMVMHAELLRICGDGAKTVLFVTHDLQEALTLADKVIVFSARPGVVKSVLHVDLPRPRNSFKIQFEPGFARLYNELWELLEEHIFEGEAM